MANPITADSNMTGAAGVVTTQPVNGTYKGFDGKQYKLGVNEMIQAGAADNQLQSKRALRNYQENQAAMDLQSALGTVGQLGSIDRAAIEQYKGIANNYAARGMQRSGGYATADDKAYQGAVGAKVAEQQKYDQLLAGNQIADTADQQTRNDAIYALITKYLGTEAGKKLNQIKG